MKKERAVALFLFGLLAFNPPLLSIFSKPLFVFGIPLLYLYLFFVWAGFVLLVAWNTSRTIGAGPGEPPRDGTGR